MIIARAFAKAGFPWGLHTGQVNDDVILLFLDQNSSVRHFSWTDKGH